jgi:dolichol kinase
VIVVGFTTTYAFSAYHPPGIAVINLMSGACAEYSLPVSNFEQNDNIHVYIPNCLYCNVMNLKKTVKFKQKIRVPPPLKLTATM